MHSRTRLYCALAAALLVGTFLCGAAAPDSLCMYDAAVTFRHFAYALNPDHTLRSYDRRALTDTVFKAKVIENRYLKVTLLPEFGGRILSLVYKPTGHEELYQNPIGTPYGIGEGNFYYNWLMVYGGIFPTLPEPEHGKAWCLPWETRVIEESPERIGVAMSFRDDLAPVPGVPAKFSRGRTGLSCTATVFVERDAPYLRLRLRLENTQAKPLAYEYWTCATLAPGSEPGKTLAPAQTEIIAPITRVKSKDDWWRWMASVDAPVDAGRHIFAFKNLAIFANWADMGIAYAYPGIDGSFWGAINHENGEGLFRVADNRRATPGMKLWTWGYRQSYAADPRTFGNSARPYIELWAGHSPEFFADARLAAHEVKTWDEYYIPAVGLAGVTFANEHALAYLHYGREEATGAHSFTADLFTTHPGETMDLLLRVDGAAGPELYHRQYKGEAGQTLALSLTRAAKELGPGQHKLELSLKSADGQVLAQASLDFTVK